jgi:FkbM family methyltransferase
MKKIGNWYIPDNDNENKLSAILTEDFQCIDALHTAFKYVKTFNRAIDVGTWIGDSTVLMSQKFKSITGFEPSIEVYNCCIENLKIRNISNCEILNLGLSNVAGVQPLINKGKSFSGWISTLELTGKEKRKPLFVNTCRLDDLNLENIDFIKIDVDSHEGFLIDGAQQFFKNNSPVIMIENKIKDQTKYQHKNMPDPLKILKSLNYKVVELVGKADHILIKNN